VICLDFCLLQTNQTWSQPDINHITDTIQTPEVVITGTHIKLNKDKLPLSVTVIDRHTLEESGSSSVFSALNGLVPGLFITERGISGFGVSQGAAGQISLRGIGGSPTTGVLVLIDGHPQYMGLFGHPLADMALTSQVEQVEVIRGPASVLYGTNAMGGVINLVSRRPDRDINQFRLSYGSWDSRLMNFPPPDAPKS
jgi:iron complex outermembrane receptor protein